MNIDLSKLVTAEDKILAVEVARVVGINAQIKALERDSMLNKGAREMAIWQLEDEARKYSDTYGLSVELILSGNVYYPQLKALDAECRALESQL